MMKTYFRFLLIALLACSNIVSAKSQKDFEKKVLDVLRNNPAVIEEIMIKYQQEKGKKAAEDELNKNLANRVNVDFANSPKIGNEKAKYKLVVFTDFECPYCKRGEETVKEFQSKYETLVVYKNNPLPFHKNATIAAKAALAAHKQNKFAEYKNLLFASSDKLSEELLVSLAQSLELNVEQFKADMNGEAVSKQLEDDLKQARDLHIDGTPTFFLNGVKIVGAVPLTHFENIAKKL